MTLHDLRRTCASWLAINGENLAVVGKILNHRTLANTKIYARLNLSPVKTALGKYADTLFALGPSSIRSVQPPPIDPLTPLRRNIMRQASLGRTSREIARS